jgi:hypothetical protein
MRQQGLEPTGTGMHHCRISVVNKVFLGEMIDSSTIDAATGRVEVDMCMARWREFYHSRL